MDNKILVLVCAVILIFVNHIFNEKLKNKK